MAGNELGPQMNREFLEDVVSIKISEVETLLQEKQAELEEKLKAQEVTTQAALEKLQTTCKNDAEIQIGTKLKNIVNAFNASEMFPEMAYHIGNAYGSHDLKKVEDYGVHVEIAIKVDPKAAKIARGGLPISTTTHGQALTGGKIIAATSGIVTVTPECRTAQIGLDEENKTKEEIIAQISQIRNYLNNMSSSERKIRAQVAKNHLSASEEGAEALKFLDNLGLSQALGKNVTKMLPDLK